MRQKLLICWWAIENLFSVRVSTRPISPLMTLPNPKRRAEVQEYKSTLAAVDAVELELSETHTAELAIKTHPPLSRSSAALTIML